MQDPRFEGREPKKVGLGRLFLDWRGRGRLFQSGYYLKGDKRFPQIIQFLQQHFQSQEQGFPVLALFHQSPRLIHLHLARNGNRLIFHRQASHDLMGVLLPTKPVEQSPYRFHAHNVGNTPTIRKLMSIYEAKTVPNRTINIFIKYFIRL
jgi:hypothetical protein